MDAFSVIVATVDCDLIQKILKVLLLVHKIVSRVTSNKIKK